MKLVIACAGGFGREVLTYALDAIAAGRLEAEVVGFVDDMGPDLGRFGLDLPVLSAIDAYDPADDHRVVIGLGDPQARAAVTARLAARGARFASIVHPLAWVAATAEVGEGSVVAPFATVGPWARLGNHVLVNTHAGIGHDCALGDFSVVSPHGVCNGFVTLEEGAFVASGAVVTAGRRVAAGAKVAANAVVYGDVPAGATALGNPARMMPAATV